MLNLIPKIGLEIHLELSTESKLFCQCKNDPYEIKPNKNICEICSGQPGVLPVLNKQAIVFACSLAKALKMKINNPSYFARKHYFYPDLPKNYQITQYEKPLGEDGFLEIVREKLVKKIRIRKIHLEEDAGRCIHLENYSLIDFNRAGIPLIEIVTEPDLRTPEEVEIFAEELILLIKELKISEVDAEKGQIRFEANISLAPNEELGTKVEIKNINSVKALAEAVRYEILRQEEIIRKGGKIIRETRGYDDIKKITFSQRQKEESEDYRYFYEPDLPPLVISSEIEAKVIMIETPAEYKLRLMKEYELSIREAEIFGRYRFLGHFFEETFSELLKFIENKTRTRELLVNYLLNDIWGLIQKFKINIKEESISPHDLAHLLYLLEKGRISSRLVKEALEKALINNLKIEEFIRSKETISDVEILDKIIGEILQKFPKSVSDYLKGEEKALEFIIGQIMRETNGQADPKLVREITKDKLKNINEQG